MFLVHYLLATLVNYRCSVYYPLVFVSFIVELHFPFIRPAYQPPMPRRSCIFMFFWVWGFGFWVLGFGRDTVDDEQHTGIVRQASITCAAMVRSLCCVRAFVYCVQLYGGPYLVVRLEVLECGSVECHMSPYAVN